MSLICVYFAIKFIPEAELSLVFLIWLSLVLNSNSDSLELLSYSEDDQCSRLSFNVSAFRILIKIKYHYKHSKTFSIKKIIKIKQNIV